MRKPPSEFWQTKRPESFVRLLLTLATPPVCRVLAGSRCVTLARGLCLVEGRFRLKHIVPFFLISVAWLARPSLWHTSVRGPKLAARQFDLFPSRCMHTIRPSFILCTPCHLERLSGRIRVLPALCTITNDVLDTMSEPHDILHTAPCANKYPQHITRVQAHRRDPSARRCRVNIFMKLL